MKIRGTFKKKKSEEAKLEKVEPQIGRTTKFPHTREKKNSTKKFFFAFRFRSFSSKTAIGHISRMLFICLSTPSLKIIVFSLENETGMNEAVRVRSSVSNNSANHNTEQFSRILFCAKTFLSFFFFFWSCSLRYTHIYKSKWLFTLLTKLKPGFTKYSILTFCAATASVGCNALLCHIRDATGPNACTFFRF